MIPKECKRLAEVDFPIADVSRHAAREKSIRHGHPSTLHLWWARRPLASSRAVLLALLLPDPSDAYCPPDFKAQARLLLSKVQGNAGSSDEELRRALLKFIAAFANWDLAANRNYIEVSRGLVTAAHGEESPLVVDPFAGGGSIPLEALRLGCEAFASDLNPVACLILKVMLEDVPREGPRLAENLRRLGAEIKKQAEKELADLYPRDPDGATPATYLWARTVRCEAPNCGAEIPLVRSWWLSKKSTRKRALRARVERPSGERPRVTFDVFEPHSEKEVAGGTVTRAKATCMCCGTVLPPERVRLQLSAQRGGADVVFGKRNERTGGAQLLSVAVLRSGEPGRHYRVATQRDYDAVRKSQEYVADMLTRWEHSGRKELSPFPDEPTPLGGGSGAGRAFSIHKYGMAKWGDLFTARQKAALATLVRLAKERGRDDGGPVKDALALVVGRSADYSSANASWATSGEFVRSTFGRQALPIVWDFAEAVPWSDASGNLEGAVDWAARVIEAWPASGGGQLQTADATEHPLPDETAGVWFTDPPYYDAVPYADLSDFFFVWLRRVLPAHSLLRDSFEPENALTPKRREVVQDETKRDNGRFKDRAWFEEMMAKAFAEGRRVLREDGVGSVVFAHKTTEGWEALLSGMIRGRWTITGSWPIATERPGRLRSQDSAALATSVHLVCRPRSDEAPVGDWAGVLRELPKRVGTWMERLQSEGVRGADLVFACIGPALEIFSRYGRVETAEGREVMLAAYLEKVWEVVGRTALENVLGTAEAKARNGVAGVLEEDARLTALFLWTLQGTSSGEAHEPAQDEEPVDDAETDDNEEAGESGGAGKSTGFTLVFDVVRRFAQPLGIELPKWEGRVVETKKGVVRLLPVDERAEQLFGAEGAHAVATRMEEFAAAGARPQLTLFPDEAVTAPVVRAGRGRLRAKPVGSDVSGEHLNAAREATTLDRVHAAMLLQAGGRSNALRALVKDEQERGPDFLRLANALTALYPKTSEEKRLLDAMLLAVPR
jgi:adenine-specific DNA methylase